MEHSASGGKEGAPPPFSRRPAGDRAAELKRMLVEVNQEIDRLRNSHEPNVPPPEGCAVGGGTIYTKHERTKKEATYVP